MPTLYYVYAQYFFITLKFLPNILFFKLKNLISINYKIQYNLLFL